MRRWLTRTLAVMSSVGVLMIGMLVAAEPALAIGCSGSTCTGKDPQAMGCSPGAQTIDSLILDPTFYVELRYSPNCFAAWVRVTNSWTSNPGSQNLFAQIRAYNCATATTDTCFVGQYAVQALFGSRYTKMFSMAYWVRACETDWPTGPPSVCTNPH